MRIKFVGGLALSYSALAIQAVSALRIQSDLQSKDAELGGVHPGGKPQVPAQGLAQVGASAKGWARRLGSKIHNNTPRNSSIFNLQTHLRKKIRIRIFTEWPRCGARAQRGKRPKH